VVQLDLADLGSDGEKYRHAYRWLNNFSRNDNARFVQLCQAMSLPLGTVAQQQTFETSSQATEGDGKTSACHPDTRDRAPVERQRGLA